MSGHARFWSGALALLLVCGFPLLMARVGLQYVLHLRQERMEQEHTRQLEDAVRQFLPRSQAQTLIKASLENMVRRAESDSNPLARMISLAQTAARRYPRLFSFTVFDLKGQVTYQSNPLDSRRMAVNLLRVLQEFRTTAFGLVVPNDHLMLAPYLGIQDQFPIKFKRIPVGWFETSDRPQKTWFFNHLGRYFSIFCHVHREGFDPIMGLKPLVTTERASGIALHLVDTSDGSVIGETDPDRRLSIAHVAEIFTRKWQKTVLYQDRLWSSAAIDSRYRLLVSVSMEKIQATREWLALFHVAATLILVFGLLTLWRLGQQTDPPFISIRIKLTSLFLFASGTPLIILLLISAAYLTEREKTLVQEAHQESLARLREFDAKQLEVYQRCMRQIHDFFRTFSLRQPAAYRAFAAKSNTYLRQLWVNSARMISSESVSLSLVAGSQSDKQAVQFLDATLENLMAKYHGRENPRSNRKLADLEMVFSTVAGSRVTDFFATLEEKRDTIITLNLGPLTGYFTFITLPGPERPDYIAVMWWGQDDMGRLYLREALPGEPLEDGTELMAVSRDKRLSISAVREPGLPYRFRFFLRHVAWPERPIGPWFYPLLRRTLFSGTSESQTCLYRDKPYLLTSFPGIRLNDHIYFAFRPLHAIANEISSLRIKVLAFGLLSLGFAYGLSYFLASKFLKPISDISTGVDAVQRKRFQHRIPAQDRDEFGDLSQMFNRMIESLQEVTMARQVQERLFPKSALVLGEYSTCGLSRPASDLGGDYFDYVAIDSRLLLILGDVTGHGVPAALMMAMAKATLIQCARTRAPFADLVAQFNHVFFVAGGKRSLMTVIFCEVETASHQIMLWNCGHPYPYRQSRSGTCSFVTTTGNILGIRPKPMGTPITLTIEPGERLLLYTDGLAESLSEVQTSAFDILQKYLESRPRLPVAEACADLLDHHPFVERRLPQPDDFSVLILERTS